MWSFLGLVTATIAVSLVAQVTWMLHALYFDPLANIPGPFWARFTRLWELIATLRGDFHEALCKLHDIHGPVVRIAPGSYSFNTLTDQFAIYRRRNELLKTNYYKAAEDPEFPNVFSMIDKDSHADRKNGIASLYSMSAVRQFEPVVNRINDVCIQTLASYASTRRAIDFPALMQRYAFDAIGEITIGENFGMMESGSDVKGLIRMTREITMMQGLLGLFPEWYPWIIRVLALFGIDESGAILDSLVQSSVRDQQSVASQECSSAKPKTFVARLLQLEAEGRIQPAHTMDSIGSNLAAGSDTTAVSISAALYYVYHTPHALHALRAEIDEQSKATTTSQAITIQQAQNMRYLQAVIQETLRLHPAVGYLLPRTAPAGGIELSGRMFPQGTSIGVSAWALHRNKDAFGEDAAQFRPERYLDNDGDRTPSSSFSFGAGSRTCIGKNISLLEMNMLIPRIVRDFDLDFDGQPPWTLFSTWFVWPSYQCIVRRRQRPQAI